MVLPEASSFCASTVKGEGRVTLLAATRPDRAARGSTVGLAAGAGQNPARKLSINREVRGQSRLKPTVTIATKSFPGNQLPASVPKGASLRRRAATIDHVP